MGKVIVVTSGKGGVGKTTTSANIASGLSKLGKKTAVVDFDIGLANLDAIMGCERRVVYSTSDFFKKDLPLEKIRVKDKHTDNLYVIPASKTDDKDIFKEYSEKTEELISLLRDSYDYVVIDSPAGIEGGAMEAMKFADIAFVVCNPEVSSVHDSDKMIGLIQKKHSSIEKGATSSIPTYILVTRYNSLKKDSLSVEDVVEILATNEDIQEKDGMPNVEGCLIGVIPEDDAILESSNRGIPVVIKEDSPSGFAYMDIAKRITGEYVEMIIHKPKKKGFWTKMTGR